MSVWYSIFDNDIAKQAASTRAGCACFELAWHSFEKHAFESPILKCACHVPGGQHQGNSNSPVSWPVDFVTAMVIDGKVINLVNFWKHDDINAGDDLMMYVEDRPYHEYVLSHHPKCMKKQVFAQFHFISNYSIFYHVHPI